MASLCNSDGVQVVPNGNPPMVALTLPHERSMVPYGVSVVSRWSPPIPPGVMESDAETQLNNLKEVTGPR